MLAWLRLRSAQLAIDGERPTRTEQIPVENEDASWCELCDAKLAIKMISWARKKDFNQPNAAIGRFFEDLTSKVENLNLRRPLESCDCTVFLLFTLTIRPFRVDDAKLN